MAVRKRTKRVDEAVEPPAVAPTGPRFVRRLRLRKLVMEVGIVLAGVLLALLGQQAVESMQWRQKTRIAERNITADIEQIRVLARERLNKTACADAYLAGMERAILTGDRALARRLQQLQIPSGDTYAVPLPNRPWPLESWNAAQVGQIIDHIGPDRYGDYAWLATAATTLRTLNDRQSDEVAIIGTAVYELPASPTVTADQLAALSRLRASEITMRRVAQRYLNRSEQLGITGFDSSLVPALASGLARCNAAARTVGAG